MLNCLFAIMLSSHLLPYLASSALLNLTFVTLDPLGQSIDLAHAALRQWIERHLGREATGAQADSHPEWRGRTR